MNQTLSPSAQKVQTALIDRGFDLTVVELPQTTRTSKEAAQAIGCRVEQIAKSLIFRGKETGQAYLVIASGINRVNEAGFTARVGENIEKPDADFVLQQTGYVIGGVAPLAHRQPLSAFIDEDLLQYEWIWAAAGNPFAVFRLTPQNLIEMTGGEVIRVK
jgi:prolyl-tRNA editing enzyme YbaK/EbsC (Cys-tRNA(Pro) deacylase)